MSNRLYSNRSRLKGRGRSSKPKAFSSEEKAKKWAEKSGIKNYTLKNLRPEGKKKKIKVVMAI